MKKFTFSLLAILFLFIFPLKVHAQQTQPQQQYFQAKVINISKQGNKNIGGYNNLYQDITAKILNGSEKGKIITTENGGTQGNITPNQEVSVGEMIVLNQINTPGMNKPQYFIVDKYRLNYLPYLLLFFVALLIIVVGKKGFGSLLGLAISLAVISLWVVPQILHNQNPLFVSIAGSIVILIVTTYLAHGISKQTSIALISTFFTLMLTALLSIIVVHITKLAGLTGDETYELQLGNTRTINLQGLLLGGIIIGTLGALNDITTTQSATIFEIAKENANINFSKLVSRGLVIGREHIVSLVNTLVLAYAGTSMAILIFFVLNPAHEPYWVILNSEIIFDEIVRTISGSAGLIMAVPMVTYLASWYVTRNLKHS